MSISTACYLFLSCDYFSVLCSCFSCLSEWRAFRLQLIVDTLKYVSIYIHRRMFNVYKYIYPTAQGARTIFLSTLSTFDTRSISIMWERMRILAQWPYPLRYYAHSLRITPFMSRCSYHLYLCRIWIEILFKGELTLQCSLPAGWYRRKELCASHCAHHKEGWPTSHFLQLETKRSTEGVDLSLSFC